MAKAVAFKTTSAPQKDLRFSIRASQSQKNVIAEAARLKQVTITDFVLEQALLAAEQVVAEQTHFTLPPKQWKAFCAALDAPPKVIPALRRLLTTPGVFDANE